MSHLSQYEREEEDIMRRCECGDITKAQMWEELRELQRDYRESAERAATEAYERELDNW